MVGPNHSLLHPQTTPPPQGPLLVSQTRVCPGSTRGDRPPMGHLPSHWRRAELCQRVGIRVSDISMRLRRSSAPLQSTVSDIQAWICFQTGDTRHPDVPTRTGVCWSCYSPDADDDLCGKRWTQKHSSPFLPRQTHCGRLKSRLHTPSATLRRYPSASRSTQC